MRIADHTPLYRHTGVALLRASARPLTSAPDQWPDLTDIASCREWLDRMWARDGLAVAVRQASPSLADRVDAIQTGQAVSDKQVRGATVSTVRYVLRSIGRPTPFGLFAGVSPVTLGPAGRVELRAGHRAVVRADAQWLADIITRAESCSALLERLHITVNDLTVRRGDRLELPQGTDRARVLCTAAIVAAWQAAATPVRFGDLIDKLAADFTTDRLKVRDSITALLVRPGFLLTNLRAPFTVTDPLSHMLTRLRDADAADLPEIADLLHDLDAVHAELRRHNGPTTSGVDQHQARTALISHMRALSPAGRTPIAADLVLDTTIDLPNVVAQEMAGAASALLRTTRHPAGDPAWREYQVEFTDRYGIGTQVPLLEVVSPETGLGYPARFHGSLRSTPAVAFGQRDERLLAMAWQAMADGSREIVLSHTDLADRVARKGDPDHRLQAMLTAQRGRMLAATGDARNAQYLLTRAGDLLATAEQHREPAADWISYFTAAELAGATAVSRRDLREFHDKDIGPASTAFADAVLLRDPGYDRCQAMDRVGHVAALLSEGQPEQACSVGHLALHAAAGLDSTLIRSRILTVTDAAGPFQRHPDVLGLRERTCGMAMAGAIPAA